MSEPDGMPGPLARHDDGPVFEEPWQAQVLALANNLIARGQFTDSQWSDTLGARLAAANAGGAPDTGETYYLCALAALEQLLDSQSGLRTDLLDDRTEAWRQAYLRTPHGKPVLLDT